MSRFEPHVELLSIARGAYLIFQIDVHIGLLYQEKRPKSNYFHLLQSVDALDAIRLDIQSSIV